MYKIGFLWGVINMEIRLVELSCRFFKTAGFRPFLGPPAKMKIVRKLILLPALQVNIFHESIFLIVQYKYLKSCSGDFNSPNLILRTRSCLLV